MTKINNLTYEENLNIIVPKVNELLKNLTKVEAKHFSVVTNKLLGDILTSRVVVDMFLKEKPLEDMEVNEIYSIHLLGSKAMVLHVSNVKNELDQGLVYNLI